MFLRGKPIAVGAERGIVTAFSYEAKRLGVTRALSAIILRKQFPEVFLVHSDYRKYSLFSERMVDIVRQYTDDIEYASIDECYADMTEVVRDFASVETFARALQDELCIKLGLTVSIGVGTTKSLAKISSGLGKPRGLTVVYPDKIIETLGTLSVRKISGVGAQTTKMLEKLGVYTIGDFIQKDTSWVTRHGNKALLELHSELHGTPVWSLSVDAEVPKSVSKMHTFTTPVEDKKVLLAKLSEQCEIVGLKLRQVGLRAGAITFGVICLPNIHEMDTETVHFQTPTNDPSIIFAAIEKEFFRLYDSLGAYRAVRVSTHGRLFSVDEIAEAGTVQTSLFDETAPSTPREKKKDTDTLGTLLASIPVQRASSIVFTKDRGHTSDIEKPHTKNTATPLIKSKIGNKVLQIPCLGVVR